jgi:hypothetical protein
MRILKKLVKQTKDYYNNKFGYDEKLELMKEEHFKMDRKIRELGWQLIKFTDPNINKKSFSICGDTLNEIVKCFYKQKKLRYYIENYDIKRGGNRV